MPTRILCLIAVICLIAMGCVPSLHPLYTSEDVVFDPALVGTWIDEDQNETWDFSRDGDHAYTLQYTDEHGHPGTFDVRLVQLDTLRFLDLFPVRPDTGVNDFYQLHLIGAHTFAHVRQIGPTLELATLDTDKLEALLKTQPNAIRCDTVDDAIILTAPTDELRLFLPAHVTNEDIFGDYTALSKTK